METKMNIIDQVLELAYEIEKIHFRTSTIANIIYAYRQITGASLSEAQEWYRNA